MTHSHYVKVRDARHLESLGELARTAKGSLCLDFFGVDVVSAAGLGVLVTLHKKVPLRLTHVGPSTYEVFKVTGLAGVLVIRGPKKSVLVVEDDPRR